MITLLLITLISHASAFCSDYTSNELRCSFDDRSKWMAAIYGGYYLSDLSIPGTHDSGAWTLGLNIYARTQGYGFKEQVRMGVRFFDWRIANTNDGLLLYHGSFSTGVKFRDILRDAANFLYNNNGEALIFSIKCERGSDCSTLHRRYYSEINQYVNTDWNNANYNKFWVFTENRVPRLDEVRGSVVIVSRMEGVDGLDWGGSNFAISDTYWRCDQTKVDDMWGRLKWVNSNPWPWSITFASCTDGRPLYDIAWDYNQKVVNWIFANNQDNWNWGTVVMDFPGTHAVGALVRTNNGKVSRGWIIDENGVPQETGQTTLSTGAIVGIVVGCVTGLIIIGVIIAAVVVMKSKRIDNEELGEKLNGESAVTEEEQDRQL